MATNKYQFTHSAHISPRPKPQNPHSTMWSMLAAGLAVGFMGMYFSVTRPMSSRMEMLEAELVGMQTEMHQLVGTRDDIWKTNDLLTGLRQQQRQIAEANQSLVAMRAMRNQVIALSANQDLAVDTLNQMAAMQTVLKDHSSMMEQSQACLANMVSMQDSIVEMGRKARQTQQTMTIADRAMDAIQQSTEENMSHMQTITEKIEEQVNVATEASKGLDKVEAITAQLMTSAPQLDKTTQVAERLVAMQTNLSEQTEELVQAEKNLTRLTEIESTLSMKNQEEMEASTAKLKEMIEFQQQLASNQKPISDAIETVELLEDFQQEMIHQAEQISGMRRELQEISMLRNTVEETLAVLQPLIQLSDLRRMSDVEVRDAARVILDRRIADGRSIKSPHRIAERETEKATTEEKKVEPKEVRKVPIPTDLD